MMNTYCLPALTPVVSSDSQSDFPSNLRVELPSEQPQCWMLSSKRSFVTDLALEAERPAAKKVRTGLKKPQSARMQSMKATAKQEEVQLGSDFIPTQWHVICGRAKCHFDHIGNRRLRVMIATNLQAYVEATSRTEKSKIIDNIVSQIRESVFNGGFVKKLRDGSWVEIGAAMSREKVGHSFRDCMKPMKNAVSEDDKQKIWMQAQDSIFSSLQLSRPTSPGSDSTSKMTNGTGFASTALQMNQNAILQTLLQQSDSCTVFGV